MLFQFSIGDAYEDVLRRKVVVFADAVSILHWRCEEQQRPVGRPHRVFQFSIGDAKDGKDAIDIVWGSQFQFSIGDAAETAVTPKKKART